MKKKLVSLISFALALVMAMTSLPVGAVSLRQEENASEAVSVCADELNYECRECDCVHSEYPDVIEKGDPYYEEAAAMRTKSLSLQQLREKFPHGKYWNHVGLSYNNQDGWTNSPCPSHSSVATCNAFNPNGTNLSWQCMGYAEKLGYDSTGFNPRVNANGWYTSYDVGAMNSLKAGDIVRYGEHSIFILGVNGDTVTITDCNYGYTCKIRWDATISLNHLKQNFRYVRISPGISVDVLGSEMSSGYERVLPDGNYIIANAGSTNLSEFCYLDIMGADYPAANGTNVTLWNSENPTYVDAWKLTYNDGFYTITQMGTNMALDVRDASRTSGANVWVWPNNSNPAQRWAISGNGRNGYRLQAKCSGFSLDVSGGGTASGTNIQQWQNNDSDAQSWLFIPYEPSQPIQNGRYILLSGIADGWELDVEGNTGNFEGTANVQLWDDMADSRYNSFDITKLENGYYSIIHAASGKSLDIANGLSNYHNNVVVTNVNGCNAQQWAITPNGNGYVLRARCSGMTLDVYGGVAENGTNVSSFPYNGTPAQIWRFVPAEYTVSYNVNGGYGAPPAQIKYYKRNLTLSQSIPTRSGYIFRGWAATSSAQSPAYQPGGVYTADADITLYAVWQANTHTVTFVNGHTSESITVVTVAHGSAASAPAVPEYDWYAFTGWDTDFSNVTSDLTVTAQYTEKGDVNGDGSVMIADALLIMRHSMGLVSLNNAQYADINSDGSISMLDALLVLRRAMGSI